VLEGYVREALRRARIRPNKARGQHFLIDDNVLAQIITAAGLTGEECVVEIGPGLGTLTRSLAARCWRVYAFELDSQLVQYLDRWVLPETRNVVLDDVAFNKYVLERVIAEAQAAGRELLIVTNLPYQISGAFLHSVIDYRQALSRVVVMLQREVAQRITARPGSAGYSSFSLYLQTFLAVRPVCGVSRDAFLPPPQVSSAVVRLDPLSPTEQPQPVEPARYFTLVEGVFRHRRKQMSNALRLVFSHLKQEEANAALEQAGLSPEARPEDLGMDDYVRLADVVSTLLGKMEEPEPE
jgi:16S rRNA (adenine1518-N6/adenine1519-N6)-dimethyltransferase